MRVSSYPLETLPSRHVTPWKDLSIKEASEVRTMGAAGRSLRVHHQALRKSLYPALRRFSPAKRDARNSMCIIERNHRIHPNGFREPIQRLRHCQFGTAITPCNDTRIVNVVDELVNPGPETPPPPHYRTIEPRTTSEPRSPNRNSKPKKKIDDLKVVFDFHIPFTSRDKKKKKKKDPKKSPRPEEGRSQPAMPTYDARPRGTWQPSPPRWYPPPGMPPVPPPPPQSPICGCTSGEATPPITVYSFSSENSSPSPLSPIREHRRPRARSLSLNRQHEEQKLIKQEQERRERAERIALAENEARLRAEREAEQVRKERDRERRRNEDLRAREQRRQMEAAEMERRRRSQEERDRLTQAMVARRRNEEIDRRRAAEALEREQRREAQRRREDRIRQWRIQEDRERLERQRMARIPPAPRHVAELHHHIHHHGRDSFENQARDAFEEHGDQVLNEAIRARFRDDEVRDIDGGPLRRRIIGAGERRIPDDDRRRWRSHKPDLSPLIYHVPGTLNTLYILPHEYALPPDEFAFTIWRVRIYIADKIAVAKGRTNVPIPANKDPYVYGSDSPVQITWQSFQGMKLTWGILAAVMRGLDDCLVKNNHLPFVAVWHVFDGGQEGEVGWGMIGQGKGMRRPGAIT
ncbi:MAG: hypothetical protein Q9219_001157 [cf. Caloplaca sp. 3 TL-2023]